MEYCIVDVYCNTWKRAGIQSFFSACRMKGFTLCSRIAGPSRAERSVLENRAHDTKPQRFTHRAISQPDSEAYLRKNINQELNFICFQIEFKLPLVSSFSIL